jgi:hypothetical protein
MNIAHKGVIVNAASLTGFVIAAALAPPGTSAWLFGLTCAVALVLINTVIFLVPWIRERQGGPARPAKTNWSGSNFWVTLGWILLVLTAALWWMWRRGHFLN